MSAGLEPFPEIIAHRGASHRLPENTLEAFEAGLEEGADGLELDVQLSSDGVPMVFHDEHLRKLGQRHCRIADYSAADLQAMDAGRWFSQAHAGLRVPTLEQVLTQFAGRTHLCVEIKLTEGDAAQERHRRLCELVAEMLAGVDGISVLSFHDEALGWVRDKQPSLSLVRNLDTPKSLPLVIEQRDDYAAVDFGIRRFGLRHRRKLQLLELPLHSYTCDSRRHLMRALKLGVSRIITNYPARSREIVSELIEKGIRSS